MVLPNHAARASHRRVWLIGGVLILLLTGGMAGLLLFKALSGDAAAYVTARIERGAIESTVTTSGTLNAVTTVQVGSQVSGNIVALYADFNTRVKRGQLVAQIDPAPFKAAVDQSAASLNAAKSAVISAESQLAKAQSDLATAEANTATQRANVLKQQSVVDFEAVENSRHQEMFKAGITARDDADTAQATYDQAVAELEAARASVTAAESTATSARKQIEVAQNQLEQARAIVEQDAAILSQAQLNLSHTHILAPVDGTVESRNMDVGQTVAASFQAPTIFLIAQDLTKMQVDTNVDEADVGRIHLDQPATFTVDAWPGQVFRGRVSQIRQAPINVQNVITYDIVIQVGNEDLKLFPGMTANVTVSVGRAEHVLKLPKTALRFRPRGAASVRPSVTQPQTVTIVGEKGSLQQVPVMLGLSDAMFVELTSDTLREGQSVVVGMADARSGSSAPSAAPATSPSRTGL